MAAERRRRRRAGDAEKAVNHDERAPRRGEDGGRERDMRLVDPWAMLLEGLLREPAAGEDTAAGRDGERE